MLQRAQDLLTRSQGLILPFVIHSTALFPNPAPPPIPRARAHKHTQPGYQADRMRIGIFAAAHWSSLRSNRQAAASGDGAAKLTIRMAASG